MGASLARHVRPHHLEGGVLTVTVDDPGWVTQLRFLHDDLVRALNDHAGKPVVEKVVAKVTGGPARPKRSHPQW